MYHFSPFSVQRNEVRLFIAIVPRQALFVFPTGNRVFQTSPVIFREEITNIGIVFKLCGYLRFPVLLFFQNAVIRFDCSPVRLPGICFQPFLKRDIERKALPNSLDKKYPVRFRAGKIFFYYRVVGDLDGFSSRFFPAARLGSTFPVSRKQAILSVSLILPPETGRAFSLQKSTSSCFR